MILAIQRQPGTNTIEVVDSIKKLLPVFRAQIPASVNLNILYDRSVSIRESVKDVKFTLVLTICLVVLVIFLFLRNLSATIIPSLALPFSIIGTFAAMYLMNFSIDNISLMALTLSVGFVVDDAIVMLENIVRHMEHGEGVMEAALKGSKEIGFTILSMTLSLVAVFIPVLFMGGIMGRLLHEFAVTISMAILISGFVSLTLTPMLCSRFLRPPGTERHGRLYLFMERFFDGMLHGYERTLQKVLRYPPHHHGGHDCSHRCDGLPVYQNADGIPADGRHRPDLRHNRGGPGDFLRGHEGPPAAAGRNCQPRTRMSRPSCRPSAAAPSA